MGDRSGGDRSERQAVRQPPSVSGTRVDDGICGDRPHRRLVHRVGLTSGVAASVDVEPPVPRRTADAGARYLGCRDGRSAIIGPSRTITAV